MESSAWKRDLSDAPSGESQADGFSSIPGNQGTQHRQYLQSSCYHMRKACDFETGSHFLQEL